MAKKNNDQLKQLKEYADSVMDAYNRSFRVITSMPETYKEIKYRGEIINFHDLSLTDYIIFVQFLKDAYPEDVRMFWEWVSDGLYDVLLIDYNSDVKEGILIPNYQSFMISTAFTYIFTYLPALPK